MQPLTRTLLSVGAALALATGAALAADTDVVSGASPSIGEHGNMSAEDKARIEARMAEWRDALNLSPEQQAIMAEIVMDYGQRLRPLFERGAETAWSIMSVAPKDPDYSLDTERAAQAAAETAADIVRLLSEMRSAVNSIMTAEQVATLEALLEERREQLREYARQKAAQAEEKAQAEEQAE